ncbi:MAG: aldolase/citrate lyase family protein [Kiloniellales bacterium]|nr:aldolase/citrate lyase family protein [Kiloniellales bacterium]
MTEARLKAMARTRALKAGHFIFEFDTPGMGRICKNAGCEFVILDTEHSGFGIETTKRMLRFFEAADLPTIVRVPSKDYKDIARACDAGAEGVMLPMVSTPEEAERIVRSMKYTPRGDRGVILRAALDGYTEGPTGEKLAAQNARTTLFAQIETAEGVGNAEAIAAIDGVDCLWVGHFDLSCSLGIPGQFDHPDFVGAIEAVIAAGRKAGKSLGRLVPDVASGAALYKQGFDFIAYSADAWVLGDALADALRNLREACA